MDRVRTDMLTHSQQALLALLRAALWDTPLELAPFPLTAGEWEDVYAEACHQTVQGMIYIALQQLPPEMAPPQALTFRWTTSVATIIGNYRRTANTVRLTHRLLNELGAEPVLQKGLSVAAFYERPELRVNGDIDWYIPDTDVFNRLNELLPTHGIDCESRPDGSLCFMKDGIEVELHPHLFDIHHPRRLRTVEALTAAEDWHTLQLPETEDSSLFTPGPIATLVMLSTHIFKHTCTVGIGLRQFCDLARAYRVLHGRYDSTALQHALQSAGLWSWCQLLHTMLADVLATPTDILPYPPARSSSASRKLTADVLSWGNFGHTAHDAKLSSKGHTVACILSRLPYSLRYAPTETICMILRLVNGQNEK